MLKNINVASLIMILALTPFMANAQVLYRQLQTGMSGSDIGALQTYLATDPSLYPQGLVTDYFGFLTKSAVANFQSRNGIPAVGRVGPATLPVLNAKMSGTSVSSPGSAPLITSVNTGVSRNSTQVAWNTNELARGVVYYSTSPLTTYEGENSVSVSGQTASTDMQNRNSHNVTVQGLQANTTYYYLIYVTDVDGNVSVTWPSTFTTTQ